MTRAGRHLTFANAVACICLFVVLGGTSVAEDAVSSAKRLISGKQVKDRSLTAVDVKKGSLTGAEVKDRSLSPTDFSGSVAGPAGPAGPPGPTGAAGPVGQIQGAAAGGDLRGTYPNPTLSPSLLDAAPGTPSLRSLGAGANQAAAGNDGRLSNARTPTGAVPAGDLSGSYPSPTIRDGAVSASKLAPPGAFVGAGLSDAFPACDDTGTPWQNISPNVNNAVSFYRDPFGVVSLRGIAMRCSGAANPIFTLPAGFRPARQEIQPAVHSSGSARRVNINADGKVVADVLPADGEWLSLDGMTFRCAPAGANGCP